jgi:hypothetical protein
MRNQRTLPTAALLTLALLLCFGMGPARAGSITYDVSVDTSSLNGQPGNLDFQFNPGGAGAESATATVTNFQTVGGIPALSSTITGDASGVLPATLTLNNSAAFNDIFQGFTYGTTVSFDVTLSGTALDGPGGTVGSSFLFSLYDNSTPDPLPLLTTDSNGSVLTINVNPDGTTTPMPFPSTPGGTSVASATPAASAAPEPSSIVLLVSALPVGLLARRRQRPSRDR